MILVDANLLVYAWDGDSPHHEPAAEWLNGRMNGTARVGLPWQSTTAFLRVVTNPRICQQPATMRQAWRQVEEWLECDNAWIPVAGAGHRAILGRLFPHLGGGPRLITDAHLAALAIEHGLTLFSADGDFARFPGLRWENPLRSHAGRT